MKTFLIAALLVVGAQTSVQAYGQAFYPGGVVDEKNMVLYSISVGEAVQVIDLKSGTVKATFNQGEFPIALTADGLIAAKTAKVQGSQNGLEIVTLDSQSGAVKSTSPLLSMPEWIPTEMGLSGFTGSSFEVGFNFGGNDLLTIDWSAETHYDGGAAPPPWVQQASRNEARGEFTLYVGKAGFRAPPTSWLCEGNAGGTPPCQDSGVAPSNGVTSDGNEYILNTLNVGGVILKEVEAKQPIGGGQYGEIPISVKALDRATGAVLFTQKIAHVFRSPPRP